MDRELVEQAQRGDREAYAVLARTRADRLMAIAQRILRDVGWAEDAVQQTLVIAWRELPSLRATVLPDGSVLVVGSSTTGFGKSTTQGTPSAELLDPASIR